MRTTWWLPLVSVMLSLALGRTAQAADPVLQRETKLARKVTLQTRRIHLGLFWSGWVRSAA